MKQPEAMPMFSARKLILPRKRLPSFRQMLVLSIGLAAAWTVTSVASSAISAAFNRLAEATQDDDAAVAHLSFVRRKKKSQGLMSKRRGKRRVILFRHCVRSTQTNCKLAGCERSFRSGQDFTDEPLPQWGTPTKWCTNGGWEIMVNTGSVLRKKYGIDMSSLQIVSDHEMRDTQTSLGLAQGIIGSDSTSSYNIKHDALTFSTFDPEVGQAICNEPSKDLQKSEVEYLLANTEIPMGVGLPNSSSYAAKMAGILEQLEDLIGKGRAGSLSALNYPMAVNDDAKVVGAVNVLKFFAQQMLYSWASGIHYSKATPETMYELSSWIYYQRRVGYSPSALTSKGALLALSILNDLDGGIPIGANKIYVGHDTDLDTMKVVFGLDWLAPPFPSDFGPTPPGSALVFTMDDVSGEVEIEFLYTAFNGSTSAPVTFAKVQPSKLTLDFLKQRRNDALTRYDAARDCNTAAEKYLKDVLKTAGGIY